MQAASREAVAELRPTQQAIIDRAGSVADLTGLAAELYSVASLFVAQPRLRRLLGDPASLPDSRAQLVGQLLDGRVGAAALELAQAAVRQRWSTPWDLTDTLEASGDEALFAAAEREGTLDDVEDELFRFERILDAASELTASLDEASVEPARRVALLDDLVSGKVAPVTRSLLEHAVTSSRKRSVILAVDDLLEAAAARQQRSMARVTSAVELTQPQLARLTAALTDLYGRPITVRTAIDPAVRGGLVIRVADEIIDGSVASRLLAARSALAG